MTISRRNFLKTGGAQRNLIKTQRNKKITLSNTEDPLRSAEKN